MWMQVSIRPDLIRDSRKGDEEGFVVTSVESIQEIRQIRNFTNDGQNLRCIHNLLLQRNTVQRDDAGDDRVKDEGII
jgi:hypothetical protein